MRQITLKLDDKLAELISNNSDSLNIKPEDYIREIIEIQHNSNTITLEIPEKIKESLGVWSNAVNVEVESLVLLLLSEGISRAMALGRFPISINNQHQIIIKTLNSILGNKSEVTPLEVDKIRELYQLSDGELTDIFEIIKVYRNKKKRGKKSIREFVDWFLN